MNSDYLTLIIFSVLFVVGFFAGSVNERRHYRSIARREKELLRIPAITMKSGFEPSRASHSRMTSGSVVVSIDYFKRAIAALRNIVGGSVRSYETLVDRARREAVLRLKENAGDADLIVNLRIETSAIGKSAQSRGSVGSVEALAYGTAVWLEPLH